jgi:hypothetical protein
MSLFSQGAVRQLPARILDLLNASTEEMGLRANASPRTVGDRTQEYLAEKLVELLPANLIDGYTAEFSRRAMADLAFEDSDRNYYVVDVKTHCRSTQFNMPNLISVERLTRFYEEPRNFFCILIVGYESVEDIWRFTECVFVPVEHLDWSCLTIGALGWGQLQIANANRICVSPSTRHMWMLALCDALLHFYPREIEKVGARITYFEAAKERWLQREDV